MRKIVLFLIISLLLLSCQKQEKQKKVKIKNYKVGVVLGLDESGYQLFNKSIRKKLLKQQKTGIKFKEVKPDILPQYNQFLTEFVEAEYDLIIGISPDAKKTIYNLAKEYPNKNFVIIGDIIDLPNVKSIVFDFKEASFLAGALGEMISNNKSLGFIGAANTPLLSTVYKEYKKGALYINPKVKIVDKYIDGNPPFNNPKKAIQIATSMAKNSIDVIYTFAGNLSENMITTPIQDNKFYTIKATYNSEQNGSKKIIDFTYPKIVAAIISVANEGSNSKFKGGTTLLNIKNSGMEIVDFQSLKNIISKKEIKKLEQIKKDIVSDKIKTD